MTRSIIVVSAFAVVLAAPSIVDAHCDTLDGPVVNAAIKSLDSRDVSYALVWVQPEGEAEVRAAFVQALAVRVYGAAARALADQYFSETLVRVHRTGEGAAFTGLKPAGQGSSPAITTADDALDAGVLKPLADLLTAELTEGLRRHFAEVAVARNYDPHDLAAGRRFVKAYVEYVHFVERLHEAIATAPRGHFTEDTPR